MDVASKSVSIDCPAKINLHLRIGPARSDGFHPLLTWMVTVGLTDRLILQQKELAAGTGADDVSTAKVQLACDPPALPTDDRNLVVRAIKLWTKVQTDRGRDVPPLLATLLKRTPSGAGLGGGSSDAAGTLLALGRLLATDESRLTTETLATLAAQLGSDIPFFLYAPSAICSGRGEIVRPIAPPAAKWTVLILPPIHMPTPDVYRKFDAMGLGRNSDVQHEPDWAAWSQLPATELMQRIVNDLEAPAFAINAELSNLRDRAEQSAQQIVRMSGSGSSLFTLFNQESDAQVCCKRLKRDLDREGGGSETVIQTVRIAVPMVVEVD